MPAPRKLTPADEAALREWYVLYQDALTQLHGLGSIRAKAKQYGVDTRTVHNIVKREQYELSRKCRDAELSPPMKNQI